MILTADFHSHILPGIDDGARNTEESLRILDMMGSSLTDGTHCVVATPHFKTHEADDAVVESFVSDRAEAFESLKKVAPEKCKNIVLGSEVALNREITECDSLSKLVMGNSDIIMLEMPFLPYKPWLYDVVANIRYTHKLMPMIAHFERYFSLYKRDDYRELFEFPDAIFQFNASSLKDRKLRKLIFTALESGIPLVMGSDCHDTKSRAPDYEDGLRILSKKLGKEGFEYFKDMSANIIAEMK
ncbi:MAG: hypothetical protein E7384_01635 [Ruminococcaceae bacterium]|nr:hypothetical protein [Oscillospiraceae bacterium]